VRIIFQRQASNTSTPSKQNSNTTTKRQSLIRTKRVDWKKSSFEKGIRMRIFATEKSEFFGRPFLNEQILSRNVTIHQTSLDLVVCEAEKWRMMPQT
jgi:hypothetical protein